MAQAERENKMNEWTDGWYGRRLGCGVIREEPGWQWAHREAVAVEQRNTTDYISKAIMSFD